MVYPKALCAIGLTYRIRGIGGASAGAIGAAAGAPAEFGRASGGFDRLEALPSELGGGNMATLFQPSPSTKPLLRLMLAATGNDKSSPPEQSRRASRRPLSACVGLLQCYAALSQ